MYFVFSPFIKLFQISFLYRKILYLFVSNKKKSFIIVFHIRFLYRKILHLTDVHIDLAYMEGAEAACGSIFFQNPKIYKSFQIVPYLFYLSSFFISL